MLLVSRVIATSKIVHSQLQRARETAQQQLQEDTLLNEGQPAAVSTFYTSIPWSSWIVSINLFKDHEQFDAVFRKYFFRSDAVEGNIIVCHANIIRYFVCRLVKWSNNPEAIVDDVHILKQVFANNPSCTAKNVSKSLLINQDMHPQWWHRHTTQLWLYIPVPQLHLKLSLASKFSNSHLLQLWRVMCTVTWRTLASVLSASRKRESCTFLLYVWWPATMDAESQFAGI